MVVENGVHERLNMERDPTTTPTGVGRSSSAADAAPRRPSTRLRPRISLDIQRYSQNPLASPGGELASPRESSVIESRERQQTTWGSYKPDYSTSSTAGGRVRYFTDTTAYTRCRQQHNTCVSVCDANGERSAHAPIQNEMRDTPLALHIHYYVRPC